MKRIFSTLLKLIALASVSFAQQNDCGNNAGFESGTVAGWICKSGYYGSAPCPPTGTCPRMGTTYTAFGQLNTGGINASTTDPAATNRHVITTGAGTDPNSGGVVPVVAPGGGTYSCRLGNGNSGGAPSGSTNSAAEAIRLTFTVNANNAGFTYRYAFFVQDPGHPYESQPSFEVVVLDANDVVIPCGRYFVVGGNYPACVNTAGFQNGVNGFTFRNWTNVGLDLTGYMGQSMSVEFRTTDCDPAGGSSSTTCINNVCTLCSNGACCTYTSPATSCTPAGGACSYAGGTHSAYAYIDAYCSPLQIQAPVFCAGAASIQICAPAGYVSYTWPAGQPGLSGSPTTQCATITNPVAGTTYTVNMTSATGCPTHTTVTLLGATPTVNSPTICAGQPTTLTAAGGTGNYSWSPGGSTSTSIVVAPTVTTTYTVTAAATGSITCPSSATATVTVGNMAATITPPQTICPGASATISATGSGSGTPVYSWSNGSTSSSIIVSPGTTTTYSVSVTNGLCTATGTTTVTVAPITATVSPPQTICQGSSASLSAGGGTTYSWSPGGATTPSITVSPSSTTTYMVVVTNAAGCKDSTTTSITVNSVNPTISGPVTICTGDMASITATGGGTYAWTPGGSTSGTINVSPATTTTYSVTVTNGGCSSTLSQTITVNPFITASITPPPPVCIGNSVTLTASGGTAYTWSTGASSPSIVITNPPAGTSSYSVIVSSGSSCVDSAYVNVIVNPLPIPTISPNTTVCLGTSTQFTAGGGTSYSWTPGGSTSNPLVVNPPVGSSTYTVLVTDANGCTADTFANVLVNPIPSPTATSATICAGASAVLTATGGVTYTWSNGQTGPTLTASPGTTTTYTVVAANAGGCTNTAQGTINVLAAPVAAFTSNLPCLGAVSQLTDGSIPTAGDPIVTWSWTMNGGTPPTSANQNPSVMYTTAGPHNVTLIVVSQNGCSDTLDQQVVIYNQPIALFNERDSGCAPICVDFSDLSQAVDGSLTSWVWTFPGGSPASSTSQNPSRICYATPGSYGASLTVTNTYGCTNSITLNNIINAYPTPKADFCVAPTKASATDPNFTFCDLWSLGVTHWTWNFGDGSALDSTSTDPTHSYSATATANDFYTFTVLLTVENQYGCKDTISKKVELLPEFTFYIPNCFTPNGDFGNDLFYGKGRGIKEYNIWLFDRWGNQIWDCHYEGKNTDWDKQGAEGMSSYCKWDGKVQKGGADMSGASKQLVQEDVYVWKVKLTDIFDKQHSYVGHLSVLK